MARTKRTANFRDKETQECMRRTDPNYVNGRYRNLPTRVDTKVADEPDESQSEGEELIESTSPPTAEQNNEQDVSGKDEVPEDEPPKEATSARSVVSGKDNDNGSKVQVPSKVPKTQVPEKVPDTKGPSNPDDEVAGSEESEAVESPKVAENNPTKPKTRQEMGQPYVFFEADTEEDKNIWLDYENHKGVPFDKLAKEKFYGPIAIKLLKHGFVDFFIRKTNWFRAGRVTVTLEPYLLRDMGPVEVYVRQRLLVKPEHADDNKVEYTYWSQKLSEAKVLQALRDDVRALNRQAFRKAESTNILRFIQVQQHGKCLSA